jgi:hypothetical protein
MMDATGMSHQSSRRRRHTAAFLVSLVSLITAMLACTSNDSLFIHLTPTRVPSVTPTPLTGDTRFKIKDKVFIVSWTFQITMATSPEMPSSQVAALSTCFPNTQVQIQDVSKNRTDPNDKTLYYEVQCGASKGWVPEFWLTYLDPAGSAVVKSADGKGATLYSSPDVGSKPVSSEPCAEGTTVQISGLTQNPDATPAKPDNNIYVQVTCGTMTGYALESALVPAGS